MHSMRTRVFQPTVRENSYLLARVQEHSSKRAVERTQRFRRSTAENIQKSQKARQFREPEQGNFRRYAVRKRL
jgi:hypothetical protein